MSVFCSTCGCEAADGQKFCMKCGSKLPNIAAEMIVPTFYTGSEGVADVTPAPVEQTIAETPAMQGFEQPVAQFYQPMPQEYPMNQMVQPMPQKAPRRKLGFGRRLLAFMLCMLLFVIGSATILFHAVKRSISSDNISKAFTEVDILDMEVGQLVGDADNKQSLLSYVFERIPEAQKAAYPELNEENISELLENKAIRKAVSDVLGGTLEYFTGENDHFEINAEKVIKVLKKNEDLIEELTGKKMLEEDFDAIRDTLEDINENELKKITKDEDETLTKMLKYIRMFLSDTSQYILYGIVAFFTLMIFLACGRFVDSALLHTGVTAALSGGLIFGTVKLGGEKVAELLEDTVGKTIYSLFEALLFNNVAKTGLIVLIAGGVLILIGIIYKVVRRAIS